VIELLLLSLILLAFVAAIDGLRFPGTLYAFYGLSVSIYSLCGKRKRRENDEKRKKKKRRDQ